MKKLLLLLTLFAFVAACESDDDTTNTQAEMGVNFQALYDGAPLEKNKNYPFDGYDLQFTRFHTFLSDIELLKADGSTVLLSEIEFVDFTPDDAANDLSVVPHYHFENVPQGTYTGLRMGIGVKPSLNGKNSSSYPVGHPLYQETEFWSGWKSFIFTKVEGKADLNKDNVADFFLVHHYGSNPVYRTYTYNTPITVSDDHADHEMLVTFDLKKMFTMPDGSAYNLAAHPQTSHNQVDISIAEVIVEHYGRAINAEQK